MAFTVHAVMPGVWHIVDCMGVCMTLLEGENAAMLVDTGYGIEDVADFMHHMTDLPLTVFLTHNHHDHAMGARCFPETYMLEADMADWRMCTNDEMRRRVLTQAIGKNLTVEEKTFLAGEIPLPKVMKPGVSDLGGLTAEISEAPGHTPGSAVVYVPERKLIEDFNLSVKPGQRVAIVGPTGCGKTTLINLLMRFYDMNSGTIKVSDIPLQQLTRKSLRDNYGMVLQETWLRSGSIRDNIAMGKPDATDEEIIAAAKASHAHGFIKRLPEGYDTVIAEDGGNLSQGQKQLLCIARVMLCLPPMLILDEATSSIDTRTEIKIQNAFAKMMQGRTSFIVAHRLSTIREADIILVMKDGSIIEQGNHEELLEKNGFYAKLYNSQFAKTS